MTGAIEMKLAKLLAVFALWGGVATMAFAQEPQQPQPQPQQPQQETPAEPEEDTPVSGGVIYKPVVKNEDNKYRDPFKSPFEIEQEKKEQEKTGRSSRNLENVEQYDIGELDLRGIYLDSRTGYWAVFKIGDEHDWFQESTRFRDGDLINITDSAVIFSFYPNDDEGTVREIVKELHRGEE